MRCGYLDDLALATLKVMQMAQNFAQLVDNGAGGDEKKLASLSQLNRCAGTIHQGQAQRRFQAAYTPAEGGLGDETSLGRLGKLRVEARALKSSSHLLSRFMKQISRRAPKWNTLECQLASHETLCRLCIG